MRKINLLLLVLLMSFGGIMYLPSCDLLNLDDDQEEEGDVTETIFTNPDDGQIIQLDSAGRKATFIGTKDANGMPISITQAIVDGEDLSAEAQTLIEFDSEGRATSLSSELYGYMTLEYVSDTQVVVVYALPDNEGSYQLTFNPYGQEKAGDCGCPGKINTEPVGFALRDMQNMPENQVDYQEEIPYGNVKSTTELEGNIYTIFNQTANPVLGNTVSGTYSTPKGQSGALKITKAGAGRFKYYFPSNPAPPPPDGLSAKAVSLLNGVCLGALPLALAKHAICLKFIHPLAILKCEAVLTAYVWLCRANTLKRVGSYMYDIYSAEKVDLSVTSLHPSLPVKKASTTITPSSGYLTDINIVYDPHAVIGSLSTIPSDPAPSQGYTIKCVLLNGIPNVDQVILTMTGSDGYSAEQTFTLDATLTCTMGIPGAEEGVKDVITGTVINADPQPGQSKTISIIF